MKAARQLAQVVDHLVQPALSETADDHRGVLAVTTFLQAQSLPLS
jgi:hypothetical protein